MSLSIVDSDMLTLWLRGHESVAKRIASADPSDLAITIITVEEVLRGWYTQIRQAKNDAQLERAYRSLQQAVEFMSRVRILPFDAAGIARYRELRSSHRRTGTNDLRIAAIALENGATLVTRNTSDFADIEGLNLDDWS